MDRIHCLEVTACGQRRKFPRSPTFPRTSGAQVQPIEGGIRLSREDHGKVHYERSIEIRLEADAPRLHLVHTLRNLSTQPLNVAPWAITVLPPHSRVRVPLSSRRHEPERVSPRPEYCLLAL